MESHLKVLHVDASTGFYKVERFGIGEFFGPVDLGLYLAGKHNSLNMGTGLLCGSIFPGSNRMVFTGFSPCWGSFFISSMGGAGLVFDNLGINMLAIRSTASHPSVLYLNRMHGEEIEVAVSPLDVDRIWATGRKGVYSLMDTVYERFAHRYKEEPRILAVGPAARATDFGAIVSVPVRKEGLSRVDTWAGRGGFGSKLFQQHGLAAVIYGGTYADEDFRDKTVANQWFEQRYHMKLATKDLEATTKYRFDEDLETGGTFGVNFSKIGGKVIAFNYKSIYMDESQRQALHRDLIADHYLKQFNQELKRQPRNRAMKNCGEPCVALCKKMFGEFKKDYEPYQTMGPLCGIFDQRAAEALNHHCDTLGFDGISAGGVLSWLMECVSDGIITPQELGLRGEPVFSIDGFSAASDSKHNADIGMALLDAFIGGRGAFDLRGGARKLAHDLAKQKGRSVVDRFVFNANAHKGWIVPNQYWTPGVLSPMPIMGKYYMYYGDEFYEPRELGRKNAERMKKELVSDNTGFCRFHRQWSEEMVPEIIGTLYDKKQAFLDNINSTAARIGSRNAAAFWESKRNIDFVFTCLERIRDVEKGSNRALLDWLDAFHRDKHRAAFDYWYEVHKGIVETLRGAR